MQSYEHYIECELAEYLRLILAANSRFLENITSSHEIPFNVKVDKYEQVRQFEIKIDTSNIKNYETYNVKMRENVREEASRVKSLGFSYNIHNLYDLNDFLRFDLDLKLESKGFEALHANANKEKWKKEHLIYPSDINLNLTKLNYYKAILIFLKYVSRASDHPYDNTTNAVYQEILNKEGI
ncbi:MAG: hypothetical protein GX662_12530 [Trichococcus flocculiformis]|uniref:Uncharacterized protein n=1 Tax=Trichococcus flocculiformis TaxID=82803 RepID=A0A847D8B4_9LACT|nr:hypothetical protein [Trichococcus flocculiformis]NLD33059.1 hypothetical protein [Trichococcus flocculiformis]